MQTSRNDTLCCELSYLFRSRKKDFNLLNTRVGDRTCQQGCTYNKTSSLRRRKHHNDDGCKKIISPIIYWLSTAKVLCSFWNSTHRGLINTKASANVTSLKCNGTAVPVLKNRGQQS